MQTIKQLRDEIDKIDADIIERLAQRKVLSIKIGEIKAKSDKQVLDNKREEELMLLYEKLSSKYGLQSTFVKEIFKMIIANSRGLQK